MLSLPLKVLTLPSKALAVVVVRKQHGPTGDSPTLLSVPVSERSHETSVNMDRPIRVLYVDPNGEGSTPPAPLDADGVAVLRADGFETALDAVVESNSDAGDEVDCIACVHRPPTFDGLAFLEDLRARRPNLPVVVYAPGRHRRRTRQDTGHLSADVHRPPPHGRAQAPGASVRERGGPSLDN
jgi:CheY-like chemotaxis protein